MNTPHLTLEQFRDMLDRYGVACWNYDEEADDLEASLIDAYAGALARIEQLEV